MNSRESKGQKPNKAKLKAAAAAAPSAAAPSKGKKGKGSDSDGEDGDPKQKARLEEQRRKEEEKAAKRQAKKEAEMEEEAALAKVSAKGGPAKGQRVDKVAARKEKAVEEGSHERREIEEVSASGIDAALDLTTDVTTKAADKKAGVERHPERRVKAAFASFEERRLPELKKEQPGLRLSQYQDILHREWKKSSENPMNQEHVKYNEKV